MIPKVCIVFFLLTQSFFALSYAEPSKSSAELNTQNWADVVLKLKKEIQFDPKNLTSHFKLAHALFRLDRRSEALSHLGQWVLSYTGQAREQLIEGIHTFSRAFSSNQILQIFLESTSEMKKGNFIEASERLSKLIEKERNNVEILLRLAQCQLVGGDFDSAAEKLRLAKLLNPYEPEIRLWLGRALFLRGELDQSLVELKWAKEKLPKSQVAVIWISDNLVKLGRPQEAIQILEKDMQNQPFHLMSVFKQSQIQYEQLDSNPLHTNLDSIWKVRTSLQIVLSRLGEIKHSHFVQFESELGLPVYSVKTIQKETQLMIEKIDAHIQDIRDETKEKSL